MGQTNNCRATFSWKLMTLGADMQIAVGAAVRGCCCGCAGWTGLAARPGLPAACTFSSSMINCFDNFGLCRHHFQIPCQARRTIRGKMQTETGQHTHASPPAICSPLPLLPSCYFCGIADEWSQNWCMIPCGTARLSAMWGERQDL